MKPQTEGRRIRDELAARKANVRKEQAGGATEAEEIRGLIQTRTHYVRRDSTKKSKRTRKKRSGVKQKQCQHESRPSAEETGPWEPHVPRAGFSPIGAREVIQRPKESMDNFGFVVKKRVAFTDMPDSPAEADARSNQRTIRKGQLGSQLHMAAGP